MLITWEGFYYNFHYNLLERDSLSQNKLGNLFKKLTKLNPFKMNKKQTNDIITSSNTIVKAIETQSKIVYNHF